MSHATSVYTQTPNTETTCGRCRGQGRIKCFSHVLGGICFRCWGTGQDPRDITALEKWLDRARIEFKRLRSAGKEGSVECRQLVSLGKANAAKLADMVAMREGFRMTARSMYGG